MTHNPQDCNGGHGCGPDCPCPCHYQSRCEMCNEPLEEVHIVAYGKRCFECCSEECAQDCQEEINVDRHYVKQQMETWGTDYASWD